MDTKIIEQLQTTLSDEFVLVGHDLGALEALAEEKWHLRYCSAYHTM